MKQVLVGLCVRSYARQGSPKRWSHELKLDVELLQACTAQKKCEHLDAEVVQPRCNGIPRRPHLICLPGLAPDHPVLHERSSREEWATLQRTPQCCVSKRQPAISDRTCA